MTKRILAMALALLLLVAALPLTVAAGESVELPLGNSVELWVAAGEEISCYFTAEEAGTYIFQCFDGEWDFYAKQVDAEGNVLAETNDFSVESFQVELAAGETVYFLCGALGYFEYEMSLPVCLWQVIPVTGFELFDGRDEITMPFLGWQALLLALEPYDATLRGLTVSVEDESVVAWAEHGELEAMGIGQTTVTVTVDGTLTDTVTVKVVEPLPWEGTGSRPVILSKYRETQSYAFTVEEDGYYEILSEGRYDTKLSIYVEDEDGTFYLYNDSDDTYGLNFGCTGWFEAGITYYLIIDTYDAMNGPLTFPVTVREAEEEEELPDTVVGVYEESITVALGDTFFPDGWLGTTEYAVGITSADESVVTADLENGCQAVALGETTLTITTESGASDTIAVTVTAPPALVPDEKTEVTISQGMGNKVFTFTPEKDGIYVFHSFDEEGDPFVAVRDSEGNEVDLNDDSANGLNFHLEVELTGGETYLVQAGNYDVGTYEFLVAEAKPATSVTLGMGNDYAKKDGKIYYIYTGTLVYENVLFGDAIGALEEYYDITIGDESILVPDDSIWGWRGAVPGTTTITVETENGLTDTITIVVVDYLPGDYNLNGAIDGQDLAALKTYLQGEDDEDFFLLDVNEDGVVDEADLEMMTELAPVPFLWGDVDDDGEITSTDARLVLQYYAGKIGDEDLNIDLADVDGDGEITSTDARLILQLYAGKIEGFPVDEL